MGNPAALRQQGRTGQVPDQAEYLVATGPGTVAIDRADRVPLAPGHVRLRVAYAGICHSDTAKVREGQGPFPSRLGHEVSGTIVESREPGLPEGTLAAAYITDGYANEVNVPADLIVRLHPGCSLADAALAEPLACAIGAVEMLELANIPQIVLVGAGFMGLLALRLLVARGHSVTVVEPRRRARDIAIRWGAETALSPEDVAEPMTATCPMVIEATGSAAGLELAGRLVGTAGTLGILGYHQSNQGRRTVDMESWNYRALRVLSLHHRDPNDVLRWMDRAQRLSANRVVTPSELVDRHVSLAEPPDLFQHGEQGGTIKTLLDLTSGSPE